MMEGNLIVVAAPSGAGKTSLVAALVARDEKVRVSISYTTRKPRPGETDGNNYHFVTQERFTQMEKQGAFLECAQVHGNRYGTSREWVMSERARGVDVVLEIDCQGAEQIRSQISEAIGIFILPPSLEALKTRLMARGQDRPEVIATRLAAAQSEIREAANFDYVIINEDFELAARQLISVVQTARLTAARQLEWHRELFQKLQG
ncbi:MAG: guanylate kinase [Burkholderiales bacterium]